MVARLPPPLVAGGLGVAWSAFPVRLVGVALDIVELSFGNHLDGLPRRRSASGGWSAWCASTWEPGVPPAADDWLSS